MNLFDMMAKAGERERLIAQGRMLGLTDEQSRLVFDTLGPAALAGLQRAQADAGAVMRSMTDMGTRMMRGEAPAPGDMPSPFAASSSFAASPSASVFGSPQAADAVADQIAKMTGANSDAMRQLVPAFSASLLAQLAVMASLPALAPMREALQQTMGHLAGAAESPRGQEPRPRDKDQDRAPDAADMMAPVNAFLQNLSAAMGSAMTSSMGSPMPSPMAAAEPANTSKSSEPDPSADASLPPMPSISDALEAQTQAWNAFLSGLAKAAENKPSDGQASDS